MHPENNLTKLLRWLLPLVCSIVLVMMTPYTQAAPTAGAAPALSPPPPVTLEYVVRVKYAAMSIGGRSSIQWVPAGNAYTVKTAARCNMLGPILDTASEGSIGPSGLRPALFTEKRRNRDETRTLFDWKNKTLTFSASQRTLPLEEGVQDRASVVWQLASLANAHPEKLAEGQTLTFMVSGKNSIDRWDFTVGETSSLLTPAGDIQTVYLMRQDKKGKTTEVWLAPNLNWYPVKLIFSDNKDLRLEQIVKKITQR
ncbi:MAG: DUF3108 domain-containing protein [Alistipes senegalensis]|nr:DUF3108 domain-containing protein [Oxalobacter formigenes]MCM1280530.1 DUF3108 domain-containing protein [Alistipes senegalensis]